MTFYYADSLRGSDSNPGTYESPKLTAQAAISLAGPGDTVLLDGVFRETITSVPSGTGSGILPNTSQEILGPYIYDADYNPVTITSKDSSNPAELTRFKVVTAWEAVDGGGNYRSTVKHRNPMFIRINGEYAKHGDSKTTLNDGEWWFDDVVAYSGYVYIHGINPNNVPVEISDERTAWEVTGANAVRVTGIKYTGNRESATAGMRWIGCDNILVDNVEFSGCWKGLDFRGASNNCVAAFNTVTYCGDGLDANEIDTDRPTNILFYKNYCEGLYKNLNSVSWIANALTTGTVPVDHEGIAWTKTGDNMYAIGNTCKWWYDNISIYSGTVGVSNWNLLGNYLLEARDDGFQASAQSGMSIADLHVIGNIFVRNGMHDNLTDRVNNFAAHIPSSISYVEFCNNLMYQNANGYNCAAVSGVDCNNIYYDNAAREDGGTAYHSNYVGAASMEGQVIDNNRYYLAGGWRTAGGTYRTAAQFALWKSDTGKDTNSLQVDPELDADLIPTSAICIGAGVKYWGTAPRPNDFYGNPLPDEGIDIGVVQGTSHEFHPANL